MKIILTLFLLLNFSAALTLKESINLALKNSPLLESKRLLAKAKSHQKRAVYLKSFGKISIEGSYSRYNIPHTLKPLTPPIDPNITISKDIYSLGATYKVYLFRGFLDLITIDIAKLSKKEEDISYTLSKEELIYNIKALYFKGLSLKKELYYLNSYKKALEALNKKINNEFKLGKKAYIDVLKIKSSLLEAKSKIVYVQNFIKSVKNELALTIGIKKFNEFKEDIEYLKKSKYPPLIIKKANINLKKAQKEIKKAKALYYPKIAFQSYYGKNFANSEEEEIWQSSFLISYNIFDFGYKSEQLQKSKILKLSAEKKLLDTKNRLKIKIDETKLQIESLKEKLKSLKANLKYLKKIKEAEKIKYENQSSDISDYLSALAKYEHAKSDIEKTKYDIYTKLAYLNYLKADGR